MHKNIYLLLVVSSITFITIISLKESGDLSGKLLPYIDKVFHLFAYLVLTFLFVKYLLLSHPKTTLNKILTFVVVVLIIYGIIIELLQAKLTTTRMSEFGDIIANITGIILGVIIIKYSIKHKLKSNKGLFL